MKNELCEKEYELFHANIANQKALKNEVEEKRDDIKDKTKKINKGYVKQNELITKRKQIQATITKLSKNGKIIHIFFCCRPIINISQGHYLFSF